MVDLGGLRKGTNGRNAVMNNLSTQEKGPKYIDALWVIPRKGTNGVSTNGVTANLSFLFDRGTSWDTPVNLLSSSQKCQGVPFSPICRKSLLWR